MNRTILACLLSIVACAHLAALEVPQHGAIVLLGDSITEMNQYAAMIEHLLVTRLHACRPTVWNLGLAGDTAAGADARLRRDLGAVKPALVLVAFGMNDGATGAADARQRYGENERALAASIAQLGARVVLITPPPVDAALAADHGAYNERLAGIADQTLATAKELGLGAIDVYHPLLARLDDVRRREPRLALSYDGVHPTPPASLALADEIARGLELPGVVADLVVDGDGVRSLGGGAVSAAAGRVGEAVAFDLALPFLPAFVPTEMRPMLEHVPFAHDCDRFVLTVAGAPPDLAYELVADGRSLGRFAGARLADGVDLSALDEAPWSRRAKLVWEFAQLRRLHHFEAWRRGLARDVDPPLRDAVDRWCADAMRDVGELSTLMADLADPPAAYHVELRPVRRVPLATVELSPAYPLAAGGFAAVLPPESAPSSIAWRRHPLRDGAIDLLAAAHVGDGEAVFARVHLRAERDCRVRLKLGSDDGLIVLIDGRRLLERDVRRALKPEEDAVDCALAPGRHELLLRVNQGDGGCGLALAIERLDDGRVEAIE